MALSVERVARSAASSSSKTREQAAQRLGLALTTAEEASKQAEELRERTEYYLMYEEDNPHDQELRIEYLGDKFNATGARQNPAAPTIWGATPFERVAPPPQLALTDTARLPPAEEGSEGWTRSVVPRWRKQRIDIFGTPFNPAEVKQPRVMPQEQQGEEMLPGARSKAHTKSMTRAFEKQRKPMSAAVKTALEKPGIPAKKQIEQLKTARSKSMAKPPDGKFKRYVQRGVDTAYGRGLIHVPDPVLPHNDVANDPYLIKSQHNSIV